MATDHDAEMQVEARRRGAAAFVKLYPSLSWPDQARVARYASAAGLPLAGHGLTLEEIARGSIVGYSVVEHSLMVGRPWGDVLQLLAISGIRWDPTLTLHMGAVPMLNAEPDRLADAKLAGLSHESCREAAVESEFVKAVGEAAIRQRVNQLSAAVRAASEAGVRLQAGTDDHGAAWLCLPGISLLWELELLVRAGLEPLDVLRMATRGAAEAVGAGSWLGALEPGRAADLLLLDANPFQDIRNTQAIWRVVKAGHVYDPVELSRR